MTTKTAAKTTEAKPPAVKEVRPLTFAELAVAPTGRSAGRDLYKAKDGSLDRLIDVPLIITSVSFHEGDPDVKDGDDEFADFTALEATLMDDSLAVIVSGGALRNDAARLLSAMGLIETEDPTMPFQLWDGVKGNPTEAEKYTKWEKTIDGVWLAHYCKKGFRKSKRDDAPASHSFSYFLN